MTKNKYTFSFTTCSIRKLETLKIAKLYIETHDWKRVRQAVLEDNVLQQRTLRSTKRLYRELASRLKCLSLPEFDLLLSGTDEEQNQLLWLATCRRYPFIFDFAVEVIRENVTNLQFNLESSDFDAFWAAKSILYDELQSITRATKSKSRQVIFKMLEESGLKDAEGNLQQPFLSERLIRNVRATSTEDLRVFPISDVAMYI